MRKIYVFMATAIVALASCTNDTLVNDVTTPKTTGEDGAIAFSTVYKGMTRADHYGADAAALLHNKFIVGGFKGATGTSTEFNTDGSIAKAGVPATGMVFDNYQVNWVTNTAGTTQSNSADWEYVGLPFLAPSSLVNSDGVNQSIKFWDYSTDQYDFIAYSTGDAAVVTTGTAAEAIAANKVLVTAISPATASTNAYQLSGTTANLQKCYIADMVTAYKNSTDANHKYQDEVQFQFRALASKVRIALYETVPGYSVKDVKFYVDGTTALNSTDATKKVANATLFTTGDTDKDNFFTAGTYTVSFPTIGVANIGNSDYNKAHVSFAPATSGSGTTKDFSTLNYKAKKHKEKTGTQFLGESSAEASFAGLAANNYYQVTLPNEEGTVLELRIDYTLESIDGSGEEIKVYGARAFVPAIYAAWKSNYAYTYIFKISDNTNGWTSTLTGDPEGLYPITFDAVVAETQDYTQSTITTVATPSITTYQKGHVYNVVAAPGVEEYDAAKGNIFVQVMTNSSLAADLNTKGKLYEVVASNSKDKDGVVSEAEIMDALNIVSLDATPVPMNGWTLTEVSTTDANFPTFIPGADGNNITVVKNTAFEFTPAANKVYAYVYTVSTGTAEVIKKPVTLNGDTAPTDFTTAYYTDAACTTLATTYVKNTVYYQKRYQDNKNVYGVKIIRVKA